MENDFVSYEGISACWIEKCTFISGIVAMAQFATTAQRHAQRRLAPKDPDGDRRKTANPIV
jgi:hypothetical protein